MTIPGSAAIAGNGWFETDATVRSGEFKVFHPERTVALPFPVSRRLSGGWPVCACSVAGLPACEPAGTAGLSAGQVEGERQDR
jgi:hypothetical protein